MALTAGVPSSLPRVLGLVGLPLVALFLELLSLFNHSSWRLEPSLVMGLSIVGMGSGCLGCLWIKARHDYLVEIGSVVSKLAAGRQSVEPESVMLLEGPVPVRSDDEAGYLAASLNGLASAFEESLRQVDAERTRMRRVLESMDSGAILTDPEGRILLVNPSAERLLCRTQSALVGRTLLESLLHRELAASVEKTIEQSQPGAIPLYLDSSRRHVLAVVSPAGEKAGALVVFQDQEEQKRLDAMRRDFTANVSHELRTPLASIRAMAETLLCGAREDSEVAESFLNIILKETDRLATLTNDILDLARYDSGRLDLQPLDLEDLLSEVERQLQPNAAQAGLEFRTRLSSLPILLGDRSALRQVFLNLLDNAVKYTFSGAVCLTAETVNRTKPGSLSHMAPQGANGEKRADHWVAVEVADTGPGIPEEHLTRIFERFYRVDRGRSRELGGTGLGLSIARHVVESHGGRIEVRSTVGKGTTFTVWLPVGG